MQLISLPCHFNDDLQWKKLLEKISPSTPIIWEFNLGLNAPYFPTEDEMVFSSLRLALSQFTKEIWPLFEKQTSHGILYRGSADFSSFFQWSSQQVENFETWKKERPAANEAHLRRLFCKDGFAHYFQMLSHALPDELPLELCFDLAGCGTRAEKTQLLSKEGFEHFIVRKNEALTSFAICFPSELKCSGYILSKLDTLFETLKIPYRIIEETFLTESWEGVDQIYVLSEAVTSIGKRKLMGFCAAGGTVIVEGESLGLPKEVSAEAFRGRGI
ncbi:MAG: hypothetical protein FJZ64_03510 [Chlamydiae bacterium]|nr:hypothetical protein [Chlamydiota bacterium]